MLFVRAESGDRSARLRQPRAGTANAPLTFKLPHPHVYVNHYQNFSQRIPPSGRVGERYGYTALPLME